MYLSERLKVNKIYLSLLCIDNNGKMKSIYVLHSSSPIFLIPLLIFILFPHIHTPIWETEMLSVYHKINNTKFALVYSEMKNKTTKKKTTTTSTIYKNFAIVFFTILPIKTVP